MSSDLEAATKTVSIDQVFHSMIKKHINLNMGMAMSLM